MKLVGKCISFVKENKIIVFALTVVLLSFIFLALPGQFVRYGLDSTVKKPYTFDYKLNGYEFMFGIVKHIKTGKELEGAKAIGQGIAIFVMLVLCVPGLLFSKKSSFVALLTSLALVVIAILFFTISSASIKAYPADKFPGLHPVKKTDPFYSNMGWVPYVLGGLIIIAGLAMCYRTFKVLKAEAKGPVQPKGKGPTYSYLK